MIGKVCVVLRWSLQAPFLLFLILLVPSCELMSGDSLGGGASPPPADALSVSFIDVGQGDGVLVQAGEESYLIDSGRAEEGPNVVDFLRGRGWESSMASWLQPPQFRRMPELRFRALLTQGATWQVELVRA